MPRLFTALALPLEIAAELHNFKAPLPSARWIDPANYHITIRFIGDIKNTIAEELADNLAQYEADSFEIQLSGLNVFGGHRPKTLWARVLPSPQLDMLYRAHESAARKAGLTPARQKFKPHVTLARFRNTRIDAVSKYLQQHADWTSKPVLIDRFLLMSSKPRTGGGPYVVEEEFSLRNYSAWTEN